MAQRPQEQLRLVFSTVWLTWMLTTAMRQVIRYFPPPGAELNGDAYWTYLPSARLFLSDPWSFMTADASSIHVAPLGYIWPAIWGANPVITQVANSALYLLAVLLMWRLASRLGGLIAGMVATGLLVHFPELASYIPQVLTEPPYMFGLLLFLTGLTEYVLTDHRRLCWLALAATGLAVTLLVRPVLQLYAILTFIGLLGLLMVHHIKPYWLAGWDRIVNRHAVLALALALLLPALTVVKNGVYFNHWGISTGAGSGLLYGVSPFKMGLEPVFSGFEYDAGIVTQEADPTTAGHPLRARSDHIQSRAALSIVQSTSLQDNVAFFWFKFKAWMFYGPEDTFMRPKLRQFRVFEWLSILGAAACLAWRRWPAQQHQHLDAALPNKDGSAARRLGMSTFILLLALGMAGQLLPVLYNIRYNVFLMDWLLMPLAAVGIAIMARLICTRIQRPGLRHMLQALAAITLVGVLMAATGALSRSAARNMSWSMDPARPGPTELVLGRDAVGAPSMSNARMAAEDTWVLTATPSTLSIPLTVNQSLNFIDGIWRLKLTVAAPKSSHQCMAVNISLEQPAPETSWYVPRPILHINLDGKPHMYAIRGNGALRPAASGNLNLVFHCPAGTLVQWHGAQLLRSSMPEATHALITNGRPINPYRADDIR